MRKLWLLAGLAAALATAACGPRTGKVDAARIAAADTGAEWVSYGKGYAEQRYSPLDQVNASTVGRLGLAWYAEFDTDRGQEATPLVADGVLYTTTAWSKVYAFDAKTGERKWAFDPKVQGAKGFDACCDVVNRGVAVWDGKVFVGTLDGRLIALDARTGKVRWTVQTTDNSKPYTITAAPRVVKGKVLIGNGGGEYGVRGYITAYDADSGKKVWRFYTVPNAQGKADGEVSDKVLAEKANGTWFGDGWKKTGGGGTAWDAVAYDPQLDLVYFGIGNGTPWNHKRRSDGKGDNLFLSSILALKPDTGEYVWHYQTTPGESWDYTATQHIMLADLTIDGQPRKVLMQAPKNGFFYVLDRATGKLLSAKNFMPLTWATHVDMATGRPVETANARYNEKAEIATPAPYGAHNWQPMAFSPKQGLVYIPANHVPFAYADDPAYQYKPGAWNTATAGDNSLPPDPAAREAIKAQLKGELVAWDPVAQKARWRVPHRYFWNGGVLATAGDLVFQGDNEGAFSAYAAADGRKLWSYPAGTGIIAAPMTYAIDGEQYVAIMVGSGGTGQISAPAMLTERPRLPGRLLVFKLGGKASAPAYRIEEAPPLDLTQATDSQGDPTAGFLLFQTNCMVCHGTNASGRFLPDLKRTPMLLTPADWNSVVIGGAKSANGMASFKRYLTAAQAEDIRAYVLSEARRVEGLAHRPAPSEGPTRK